VGRVAELGSFGGVTLMGLDAVIYKDENEERKLASKRLGNFAHIGFLRDRVTRALGARSLVVSKILYDATHAGDSLAVPELQPLAAELQILDRSSDMEVRSFARDMLELVHIALSHERPIHFS
jgi:hypothetical protein